MQATTCCCTCSEPYGSACCYCNYHVISATIRLNMCCCTTGFAARISIVTSTAPPPNMFDIWACDSAAVDVPIWCMNVSAGGCWTVNICKSRKGGVSEKKDNV